MKEGPTKQNRKEGNKEVVHRDGVWESWMLRCSDLICSVVLRSCCFERRNKSNVRVQRSRQSERSDVTRVVVLVSVVLRVLVSVVLRMFVLVSALRFVLIFFIHIVEGIPFVSHHFVSLSSN